MDNYSGFWFAVGHVLVSKPDRSAIYATTIKDQILKYADSPLAAWFGLGLAEIAADHLVESPSYYVTPMNAAWAVDLLRRGAVECLEERFADLNYMKLSITWRSFLIKKPGSYAVIVASLDRTEEVIGRSKSYVRYCVSRHEEYNKSALS